MDVRHPLNQITASLLIAVLFLDPLLVRAAELALDASAGNASLGQAGNGVPLVNISTPNGSGLSHNKFTDYNVGQQGLILNNGTQPLTPTQLGGYIPGNANLSGGSANLILNEVNGGNASRLNGYTEVAGQAAHVIVANPHGITCDGCGFINTPKTTLTTGTPQIDNGALKGYDVDGGKIAIEGAGLNATNVDQFELITRVTEINAQVHARQLDIVTGRNEVDARTLNATAKANDGGSKPEVAIDSSALGGMYAGAIRLVGTEAGVGVKLAGDLAASAGDIHIDANGHLTMARTAAAGGLALKAQDIALQGDAYAAGNASIQTDRLDVQRSLAAGNRVQIAAQALNNPGTIEAGVRADGSTNTGSELHLEGGALHNSGKLVSHGSLATDLQQFDNAGQVAASGAGQINAQQLSNAGGTLVGQQQINVNASHLDNRGGTLAGKQSLTIHVGKRLDNRGAGLILSQAGGLTLEAGTLDNQQGVIQANSGPLDIASQSMVNDQGRIAAAAGALSLHADSLSNREGQLVADRAALSIHAGRIDNSHGRIHAQDLDVTASVQLLNHNGRLLATRGVLTLEAGEILNRSGHLQAADLLDIGGASLNNQAGVLGGTRIQLDLTGLLNNGNGLVEAADTLQLAAAGVSNTAGQLRALGSAGESRFAIGGRFDNDAGLVEIGNQRFVLSSDQLSNRGGTVRHLGSHFGLDLHDVGLAGGSFITNAELDLSAGDWTNTSLLQARKLTLAIGQFVQGIGGRLLASESIVGAGDSWRNDGSIESDGSLDLTLAGSYSGNGDLLAQGDVRVNAANAELGADAQLQAGGNMQLGVQQLMRSAGIITAGGNLTLAAPGVVNQGTLGAAGGVRVAAATLRNEQGLIFSGDDMLLLTDHFTNRYGDVYSLGELWIARDEAGSWSSRLDNHSGTVESAGDLTLRATQIENRRDVLETSQAKYAASITELPCRGAYNPGGDCDLGSNGRKVGAWQVDERDRLEVTATSAAARMIAGGNLSIQGADLLNSSSTIAAAGDLQMQLHGLQQRGFEPGEIWTTRVFTSGRKPDYYFYRDAANAFNATHADTPNPATLTQDLNHFVGLMENEYRPYAATQQIQTTGQSYAAQIQAGGDVHIVASTWFDSSVVRPSYDYVGGGNRATDTGVGTRIATPVSLNSQLPADLSQQAVDPLILPGFSLPSGQNGLFRIGAPDHPYLVETNPAFASLDNFLSSDYMLGLLGYDEQTTRRRLGDGLYEQRLIREAILARTGKRFLIDALATDEAQFRYLMNNALASKESLDLSVGVALSAEQVAALTHDIVWMEEREINGQSVLAPVLYLAQANDRIAANGALVQGRDVALISGASLHNQGILRASQALGVVAQTDVLNSGLMQADGRLALLAGDSVHNRDGGILKGSGVNVAALTGDLLNQRSVSQHHSTTSRTDHLRSFVDSAARIEADNDLQLSAGRDLHNLGGAIIAGGEAQLDAGRDLVIASVEEQNRHHRTSKGGYSKSSDITQHGSELQVGRAVTAVAGRDMAVVASTLKAGESIDLLAAGDVTIAAAANETHRDYRHKGGDKKVESQRHTINQQAAVVEAGSTLDVDAGNDLDVVSSQLKAGHDVALNAGRDTNILAAQDESASYSFEKSKGSFGRSKSEQEESYSSINIASVIEAGHDLTVNTSKATDGSLSLDGGRDVTVIGSRLQAGNDLLVGGVRDVAVLSGVEEHGAYSKKTKSGFLGMSKSGKSQLKTKASQVASELEADNDVVIAAGNDIRLRASETTAGNDVELRAGLVTDTGDINLVSANDTAYSHAENYRKKTGLSLSGGMLSVSSAKKAGKQTQSSTSFGSQVTASRDATLQAERDINVMGSSVSAGRNLMLDAGRDVSVLASQNQSSTSVWKRDRHTGVDFNSDNNGFTAFVGNEVQTEKVRESEQAATPSRLEAGVDLNVHAGRDINQTGSDAGAGRDINLRAERDIHLDAASEFFTRQTEEVRQRNGLTVNVSHNYGNTVDAIKGVGQGENAMSQVSSVLNAADSITQFVSGPTTSEHIGTTRQQTGTTQSRMNNRPSSLTARRDVSLEAGGNINARGSQIKSTRDINMAGGDITLDVARGHQTSLSEQILSQSGINGGTTFNSARVGIGGSHGTHAEQARQGISLPAQLDAGRNVNLNADRDLALIGTQIRAEQNISLKAGNDLSIRAARNDADHQMRRKSGGGEVGLALGGQDFISVYASVDIGKGRLDRVTEKQQEAYLYAGNRLNFESGRDTTVAGSRLEGREVTGKVGRDLLVSSIPDTGKVSGKELDASLTVSVGLYGSVSVSGSVGVGETTGSTDWIQNQTRIVARDKLDIRTENHTQLDGAVLASQTNHLKLDTETLGFRDIEGHDKEHSWYINAGGTYSSGGDGSTDGGPPQGGNSAAKAAVVDSGQENKDGSNSWNLSGHDYRKDRKQIVRATVSEGEVIVRSDTETGRESTEGLNRDVSKAYEITKDDEETTKLYVSSSSLEAVSNPEEKLQQWKAGAENYGRNSVQAFANLELLKHSALSAADHNRLVAALAWAPSLLVEAVDTMDGISFGMFPGVANHGGLAIQLPVLVTGDLQPVRVKGTFKTDSNGKLEIVDGKPVLIDHEVEQFDGFNKKDKIFTNGIMNGLEEAVANGLMQSGSSDGEAGFVLAYNPTHGLVGDLLESTFDKTLRGTVRSGVLRDLNGLFQQGKDANLDSLHLYGHSQGGMLTWLAIKGMNFSEIEIVSVQLSGAPVDAKQFHLDAIAAGFKEESQRIFQVNRPDDTVFFGLLPKTDAVTDLPLVLGGNAKYSDDPVARTLGAILSITSLFGSDSPHSNYSCVTCPLPPHDSVDEKIREIVINPTLIDFLGKKKSLNE